MKTVKNQIVKRNELKERVSCAPVLLLHSIATARETKSGPRAKGSMIPMKANPSAFAHKAAVPIAIAKPDDTAPTDFILSLNNRRSVTRGGRRRALDPGESSEDGAFPRDAVSHESAYR